MKTEKGMIWFLICVILFSAVVDYYIAKGASDVLYLVLMWMPALAAVTGSVVVLRDNKERFKISSLTRLCGLRRCRLRYVLMGCAVPFIYIAIPYFIYWIIYPGSFHTTATNPVGAILGVLIAVIIGNAVSLLSALGEEIGWRGFWVPIMSERIGVKKTLAITSLFWCLWHFPLIIFDDYMAGTPLWYNLLSFVLCIMPVGIIAGILSIRSESVWPSAFLHAAHNNYDQAIFGLRTVGGNKMYFVSETGVLTIVFAWILAVIFIMKYKRSRHREIETRHENE